MRRTAAAAAALSLALVLGACSSNDAAESAESAQSGTVRVDRSGDGNFPDVTGDFGEDPEISAGDEDDFKTVAVKTLHKGDGAEIATDDIVLVNYELSLWDGTKIESSFENGTAAAFPLNRVIEGWTHGLAGQHVGDRVEIVIPSEWGYGDTAQGSIPAGSTLVFVVDILDSSSDVDLDAEFLSESTRTDEQLPAGLIVGDEAGVEPSIEFEEGAQVPAESSSVVYLAGTGEKIKEGDYVLYRAVGAAFGDASTAQTTWGSSLGVVPASQANIVGTTVGSRVVVTSVSSASTGEAQSGETTPAGQVVVIDVVGVLRAED